MHANRGAVKQIRRDLEGAIEDYDDAIDLDARLFTAFFNRGIVYEARGEWEKALADFNSAIGLDPKHYRRSKAMDKVGVDFGDAIEPLGGRNVLDELEVGPNAGSIAFLGNNLYNRILNNHLYDRRIRLTASGWRLQHTGGEMLVRGYLWYRQRYDLLDPSFFAVCDRCGIRTSDERVQCVPECPNCGYAGDIECDCAAPMLNCSWRR